MHIHCTPLSFPFNVFKENTVNTCTAEVNLGKSCSYQFLFLYVTLFCFAYSPRSVFVLALFLRPLQWSVAAAELLVLTQLRCIIDCCCCLLPGSRLCLHSGVLVFASEADAELCMQFPSHTNTIFEPIFHSDDDLFKTWTSPCSRLSTIDLRAGSLESEIPLCAILILKQLSCFFFAVETDQQRDESAAELRI